MSRIEVRSPVWRRWAECSGFSVQTPEVKSVSSPLAIYDARDRAAPVSALRMFPYRSFNYQGTPMALRNAGRRQFHARRLRDSSKTTAQRTSSIKAQIILTKRLSFIEHVQSTILLLHLKTIYKDLKEIYKKVLL